LDTISFAVNRALNSLICKPCKIAIPPAHAQGHLDAAHKGSGLKIDKMAFADATKAMEVSDNLPSPPAGPGLQEFAGLQLHTGLRCHACPKIANGMVAMGVHYSKCHRDLIKPEDFPSVHFQQLNNGVMSKAKFEVQPRNLKTPSPDEMLIATIRAETDQGFSKGLDPATLNARSVSPWLLSTKWHLHVAGHIPEELMGLVKPLQEAQAPRLVTLVKQYFEDATDLIDHTDDLVLQHLNTPDPAKT
jgi:Orsellinic acid/F9775 biosynthesis cluster protein D